MTRCRICSHNRRDKLTVMRNCNQESECYTSQSPEIMTFNDKYNEQKYSCCCYCLIIMTARAALLLKVFRRSRAEQSVTPLQVSDIPMSMCKSHGRDLPVREEVDSNRDLGIYI